jgi:CTP:molybdopterin cytidylyltransferase MocA
LLIDEYAKNEAKIIASETNNSPCVPAIFDVVYLESLAQLNQDKGAKEIMIAAQKEVYMLHSKINLTDLDTTSAYEELYNSFGRE